MPVLLVWKCTLKTADLYVVYIYLLTISSLPQHIHWSFPLKKKNDSHYTPVNYSRSSHSQLLRLLRLKINFKKLLKALAHVTRGTECQPVA